MAEKGTEAGIPAPPYAGRRMALLTQHGKERLIAPVLAAAIDAQVERIGGFDTDRLGTFTRDIPRAGSQREAAVRKARIGMELSGLPLGLASEGAFGADPAAGLVPWDVEMVVLVDDVRGREITGIAQGAARMGHLATADRDAAERFAREHGFPGHALVVRPAEGPGPIAKGVRDLGTLRQAFDAARTASADRRVLCEVDLRAHCNPTRQAVIREAARNLADRLRSPCPACAAPGYWISDLRTGLPCAWCGGPTNEIASETWSCADCGHREDRPRARAETGDPAHCDRCNP